MFQGLVEVKGATDVRFGIVMDDPVGKNDGSTKNGTRHFTCESKHGVFIKASEADVRLAIFKKKKSSTKKQPVAKLPSKPTNASVRNANSGGGGSGGSSNASAVRLATAQDVGKRVLVQGLDGKGKIEFCGNVIDRKGQQMMRFGIAMDEPVGKNDGAIAGRRLFKCKMNHGVFVQVSSGRVTMATRASTSSSGGSRPAAVMPAKKASVKKSGSGGGARRPQVDSFGFAAPARSASATSSASRPSQHRPSQQRPSQQRSSQSGRAVSNPAFGGGGGGGGGQRRASTNGGGGMQKKTSKQGGACCMCCMPDWPDEVNDERRLKCCHPANLHFWKIFASIIALGITIFLQYQLAQLCEPMANWSPPCLEEGSSSPDPGMCKPSGLVLPSSNGGASRGASGVPGSSPTPPPTTFSFLGNDRNQRSGDVLPGAASAVELTPRPAWALPPPAAGTTGTGNDSGPLTKPGTAANIAVAAQVKADDDGDEEACSGHSECSTGQYCDWNRNCLACELCCTLSDGIDAACPSSCSCEFKSLPAPPRPDLPAAVALAKEDKAKSRNVRTRCSAHVDCNGYCDSGGSCYSCSLCIIDNDAIDGACPSNCGGSGAPAQGAPAQGAPAQGGSSSSGTLAGGESCPLLTCSIHAGEDGPETKPDCEGGELQRGLHETLSWSRWIVIIFFALSALTELAIVVPRLWCNCCRKKTLKYHLKETNPGVFDVW